MNSAGVDWERVADVFADTIEQPSEDRAAFLAEACAGDPPLLAAVERLIAAQSGADPEFLQRLDPTSLAEIIQSLRTPLDRAGPYRLVREIGSGGMGQVFLGERADGQFEQRVAIKLLKRGMDSDAILSRFLRERQILAALEHPHIARLLDGGVADDGRPYLVMEYVEGEPITRYCDERRLTIDDRLELFRAVCSAVEHAHRSLVVHRDLKPSNILVTKDGRPKLLDFGIAKVLAAPEQAAEPTTQTHDAGHLLTPDYAAPEQFRGGAITTSTDVYGAGAVLYELLSGRRPFGRDSTAARITRATDEDPPLLSTTAGASPWSDNAESIDAIAAARATDAVRLRRRLEGDLDTIVAMALRTSPERRYVSIEALREDIRRHQQRLPVTARPDTTGYRISRFVRRHRAGVLASATFAVLVLVFAVTATVQAVRIRQQAAALEVERDRARNEATAARETANFLVGVFEVSDPMSGGRADSIRARDLLDRGAERIASELGAQPELQARLLGVIARAYANMQLSDRAEPLVQRALALTRSSSIPDTARTIAGLQQLAQVRSHRGDHLGAESSLREAMALQQRLAPNDIRMWTLLVDLAGVLHAKGDHAGAPPVIAQSMTLFDSLPPTAFVDSRIELLRLGEMLGFSRTPERAESVYVRLVAVERANSGPRSVALATAYNGWSMVRERRGDFAAADSMLTIALAIHREIDSTSVPVAHALLRLASVVVNRGALDRSDSLYTGAIRVFRDRFGEDHRMVAVARTQFAETLLRRRRFDEAVDLFRLAIATYRRGESDAAILLPPAEGRLGVALRNAGRLSESLDAFDRSHRGFEAHFPPDYLLTANLRRDYAVALVDAGRAREAESMVRRAIPVLAKRWGEHDYRVDDARITLGRALTGLGRYAEAETELTGALGRLRTARGADDPVTRRAVEAADALARARSRQASPRE